MENMSTTLKPDKISLGVLFFGQKLRQFRMFLKLLPSGNIICCCRLLGKNERADSLVGTAEYLAPEVINGEEYGYR